MFEVKLRWSRHELQCPSPAVSGARPESALLSAAIPTLAGTEAVGELWWCVTLTKSACARRQSIASEATRDFGSIHFMSLPGSFNSCLSVQLDGFNLTTPVFPVSTEIASPSSSASTRGGFFSLHLVAARFQYREW